MKTIWNKWNSIITLKIWNTKLIWVMFVAKMANHDDKKSSWNQRLWNKNYQNKLDKNGCDKK